MLRHLTHPQAIYIHLNLNPFTYIYVYIYLHSFTNSRQLPFCFVASSLTQELTLQTWGFWRFFDGCNWHTLHEQFIILPRHPNLQTQTISKCWPHPELISFLHLRIQARNFCQQLRDHLSQTLPRKALEHHLSTVSLVSITSRPCHLRHSAMSTRLSRHDTCPSRGLLGCLCVNELWIRSLRKCCPTSRVQNVRSLHFHFQWPGDALWWIRTGTRDMSFYY